MKDQVVVKLNNNNKKFVLIIFLNNMSLYVCIIDINKGSYYVMLVNIQQPKNDFFVPLNYYHSNNLKVTRN